MEKKKEKHFLDQSYIRFVTMVKGTENAPETVESICFVQSAQNPYKRFEQIQGK